MLSESMNNEEEFSGCLHPDGKIRVLSRRTVGKTINRMIHSIEKGQLVITHTLKLKPVIRAMGIYKPPKGYHYYDGFVLIIRQFEKTGTVHTIRLTPAQLVLTLEGWVQAADLKPESMKVARLSRKIVKVGDNSEERRIISYKDFKLIREYSMVRDIRWKLLVEEDSSYSANGFFLRSIGFNKIGSH